MGDSIPVTVDYKPSKVMEDEFRTRLKELLTVRNMPDADVFELQAKAVCLAGWVLEQEQRAEQAERERDDCRAALKRMVDHHVYFFHTESDEVFTEEEKLAAVVFVAGHTVESYQRLIGRE